MKNLFNITLFTTIIIILIVFTIAIFTMGCTTQTKDEAQDLFHGLTFGFVPEPKMRFGKAYNYNSYYIPEPYGTHYMDHQLYGPY